MALFFLESFASFEKAHGTYLVRQSFYFSIYCLVLSDGVDHGPSAHAIYHEHYACVVAEMQSMNLSRTHRSGCALVRIDSVSTSN